VDYLYSNEVHDVMIHDVMKVVVVMDQFLVNVKVVIHDEVDLAVDIHDQNEEVIVAQHDVI